MNNGKPKVLGMEDTFPFGKYFQDKVKHVVLFDPRYIIWFQDEVQNYDFDDKVLREVGYF